MYYTALLIFILDQLSKSVLLTRMTEGQSIPILKNILHITCVHNTGIAFGMFKDLRVAILLISIITIFLILIYKDHFIEGIPRNKIFLGFILGGAIGNLIDRLRFAFVIDFIDLRIWPVFNVADSFISIGVVLYLIFSLIPKKA